MSQESTKCETVQSLKMEGHAESLLPAAKIVVDKHLSECEACRTLAEWDARFTTDLRNVSWPAPSASLANSVREKVSQRHRRFWLSGFASAALVLVAVALVAIQPSRELTVVEVHRDGPTAVAADDFRELAGLFQPPPVDSLDVLSLQQNGYVAALNRMGKE